MFCRYPDQESGIRGVRVWTRRGAGVRTLDAASWGLYRLDAVGKTRRVP
jgi:hypothetical protein